MILNFPDNYFEEEVRQGFTVKRLVKHIWASMMRLVGIIDSVCMRHNLSYYAACGTLLGAVREKGMIPWDTDMDIYMPRRDIELLATEYKNEFPEGFSITYFKDDIFPFLGYYRIMNSRSIVISDEFLKDNFGCPFPLWIDVFVLDNYPSDKEMAETLSAILERIIKAIVFIDREPENKKNAPYLDEIEAMTGKPLDRDGDIELSLEELYDSLTHITSDSDSTEYVLWSNYLLEHKAFVFDKGLFKAVRVPYELDGFSIIIPEGYDTILRSYYGDYMTPSVWGQYHNIYIDSYIRQIREHLKSIGREDLEHTLHLDDWYE